MTNNKTLITLQLNKDQLYTLIDAFECGEDAMAVRNAKSERIYATEDVDDDWAFNDYIEERVQLCIDRDLKGLEELKRLLYAAMDGKKEGA